MHSATIALLSLLSLTMFAAYPTASAAGVALPGCQDRCGDVSIPFPFGIGDNCSHSSWFRIICNTTYHPPRAYLHALSWSFTFLQNDTIPVQIINIDLSDDPNVAIKNSGSGISWSSQKNFSALVQLDMRRSPYLLAGKRNTFVAVGCAASAGLRNSRNEIVAGCATVCVDSVTSPSESSGCYGIGCCQTSVPTSLDYFQIEFLTTLGGSNPPPQIDAVAVVDTSNVRDNTISSFLLEGVDDRTILQWTVPDLPVDSPDYSNSRCVKNAVNNQLKGYYCTCKYDYYQGNPYLPNGCQAIKECKQCPHDCVAVGSNNTYRCPSEDKKSAVPIIGIGLGISLGTLCLVIVLYGLYQSVEKRKEIRQKQKNFKKNGGLLLRQQMSTSEGSIERINVFTSIELEKATDDFNENRILGRGGQGNVYKGMLADGTIVAIKKPKRVDERNLGQFINEVVILSKVNHRNVVKLFGCCLETEVPLLVYEFVPNGTLSQHIHHPSEDFRLTWNMRLQIASESAEALAYLHSSSSLPIYHRDIKTSNILLDDKYRAKVSDFGISKTLLIDQTHVTTCVQGTFGYIDPEFFQSQQFTEKSDVYSFGIVLLELLTGKKPFYVDRYMESKSLASEFLLLVQNSCLYDIVDAEVLEEAKKEDIESIADLAKQCLHLNGKQRPTMKEVAMALQMIKSQNRVPNESLQQIFGREEPQAVNQICMVEGSSNNPSTYTISSLFSAELGR